MKKLLLVFLAFAVTAACAQSVADAARANKANKPATKKVITDDDLSSTPATDTSSSSSSSSSNDGGNWDADIASMRSVFHEICIDPKSHQGRTLNDDHKKKIVDAAVPLRAHIDVVNERLKAYRDGLESLNRAEAAEVIATAPKDDDKDKAFSDSDKQRVLAIKDSYEAKRKALTAKSAGDLKDYEKLRDDMLAVGNECPEAAKSVR